MAFTSQWAQGSHRERERYGPASERFNADDLGQEFDRNIQISFWEQAQEALQKISGIECFRVTCAGLIFGLCQKPWDFEDIEHFEIQPRDLRGALHDSSTPLAARLEAAIAKDGTPTHLESAIRKAHSLKFRWDAQQLGIISGGRGREMDRRTPETSSSCDEVQQHEKTVGLVYWLAVMFDTVSSSMNERPVVVADEDSQHCNATASAETSTSDALSKPSQTGLSIRRWSTPLFIQDDPERPKHIPRWPCSYEAAAEAVTRAGPVKVLLFRHVSWLQNSLRRREHPGSVEDIIQSAMSLYRYWNTTYGAFFKDLVRDFPCVPPRIQSWFFCISAHWHLAALLFADLLDFVDRTQFGNTEAGRARIQNKVAERIRKASANEVSDLARVSVPPGVADSTYGDATPQSNSQSQSIPPPDFHFAVNKCTILTEPWTVLVIRAFTKAGALHIARAQDLWKTKVTDLGHEGETCEESLRRCKECIKGLWFLGKKSDMARSTAGLLYQALGNMHREIDLV
jgi:hypothetical protein